MTDKPNASAEDAAAQDGRRSLSAFMDGDSSALGGALKAWREDPGARQAWHRYHLVGDVLRSEDLAQRPQSDLAFLSQLRGRLDDEPALVALAPGPAAGPAVPTRPPVAVPQRWSSLAWAAGLAACAVLVAGRVWGPSAGPGPATVADVAMAAPAGAGAAGPAAVVLRDPRLDEYLRMHQMARGGMPVGVPGGNLRNADFSVPSPRP